MQPDEALFVSGIVLLATAALSGFVQAGKREQPAAFSAWRIVHNGGTAGAVQLLALAAVWHRFEHAPAAFTAWLAAGLIAATVAFFLGPLARALNRPIVARVFLTLGAVVGAPSYLALPIALMQ